MIESVNTYRSSDSAERRRIQGLVVVACRDRVCSLVRRTVTPKRQHEAAQVAAIGVLVALEKWEPTCGETFERSAMEEAGREIALWEKRLVAPLHENVAERAAFALAFTETPECFTPAEREAVTAVFLERRSLSAAAAHLGVTVGALQYRIGCARRLLQSLRQGES